MQATHEQMVDFLRMVHARAGGTGAILNLIRASEVRGGADLLTLTDLVSGTQTVIASILRDEERHVEYLGSWLQRFERRLSPRFVAATLERLQDAFDQLDAAFYGAFHEYLERAAA